MPEGPEVERVRQGLLILVNKRVKSSLFTDLALKYKRYQIQKANISLLEPLKVKNIVRKGKYLIWEFSGERTMFVMNHLGMTGSWYIFASQEELFHRFSENTTPYAKVMLIFTDNIVAVFDDMRNFGRFFLSTSYSNLVKEVPSLKSIGIDGLNFSFIDFLSIVRLKRNQNKPLGELLLDQRFVAGVGNIYKSESLWRAKISPFTTIKELSEEELAVLGKNICEVLEQAFAHGGSTIKNFRSVDGEGEAQKWHAVYSREDQPCLRCQKPIARTIQKNRSTFFCPNCQRPKISTIVPTEYTLNAKT